MSANHTQVIVKDPQGNVVYRYTAGYDMNMSLTTLTNGVVDGNGHNTQIIQAKTYADPTIPIAPRKLKTATAMRQVARTAREPGPTPGIAWDTA